MFNFIAVGDPVIDTHVEIDDSSAECRLIPHEDMKLCFDYGKKIPILDSFQNLGGNAANVAVGCAKFQLRSAVICTVGQDVNGETVVKELKKNDVDTSYISTDPSSKTRYSIVLDYHRERTILSYSDKKNYRWPKPAPLTDWMYYTGLSKGFESLQNEMLLYLKEHPTIKLAVNPGSYLLKYAPNQLNEVLKRTDLLILNLEEAEAILGTTLEKAKSVSAIVRGLLKKGIKEVALTDAEKGAWAGNHDTIWHMKSYPVTVIGKTGAGDAFSAGYISARHFGHDIKHALEWGIGNSANVVRHLDSHSGLLDSEGIRNVLSQFKSIQPFEV